MTTSLAPLSIAIDSLHRQPVTRYAMRHFGEVTVRYIDRKDGTVDLDAARAVFKGNVPAHAIPAEFLDAARVTFNRLGIKLSQPRAFDDDHG